MGFKKHIFGAVLIGAAIITAFSETPMAQKLLIIAVCVISAIILENTSDHNGDEQ